MKRSVEVTRVERGSVIGVESWNEDCLSAVRAALDVMGRNREQVEVTILQRERRGILRAIMGVGEAHVRVGLSPHVRRKEENEWKEREKEKRKELDRMFDRVVNCPFCYGQGALVYYENDVGRYYGSSPTLVFPGHDCRDLSLAGVTRARAGNPGDYEHFTKRECPFCSGKGTANGYYADEPCVQCDGMGYIVKKKIVRQDVGVKEVDHKKRCESCLGSGCVCILRVRPITELDHSPHMPEDVRCCGHDAYMIQLTSRNESVLRESRPRF
ncbi:MAG TPA: hypothetical protein PLO37_06925 [Candidatus Hydrogenedentes bacterium]|nr:hypothetical protein [Candidatus Hydrogenedentota bacterium]HPG66564.1 hypothetical protein [Candidatus Hydrogenedentota bacterium]